MGIDLKPHGKSQEVSWPVTRPGNVGSGERTNAIIDGPQDS